MIVASALASRLRPAAALCALLAAPQIQAQSPLDGVAEAVTSAAAAFDFRYRYEFVDQDAADREAGASTLRSRFTWTSGPVRGLVAGLEVDHVLAVGAQRYNSTVNGRTRYPVVADPEGFDLNQGFLRYRGEILATTLGRQRINHGRQRFLGGVAWRQNEQTFDAARLQATLPGAVAVDYTYLGRVNRIFGPDEGIQPAEWDSDSHLVHATFSPAPGHSLTAFGYLLDFANGNGPGNSSTTRGIDYEGHMGPASVLLSYARQSDHGDNPAELDADYYLVEGAWTFAKLGVKAGIEVLGSDDGRIAFSTPLATGHKFQGWADRFLGTPPTGVRDAYLGLSGKAGPVALVAVWHDFSADQGGGDHGRELDLSASFSPRPGTSIQLKGARYVADEHGPDTTKLWLTLRTRL